MTSARDIADRYRDLLAQLDPIGATSAGLAGHDAEMTDYSPEGFEARAELARTTLDDLDDAEQTTDDERRSAALLKERLGVELDNHDAGEHFREVRILWSPLQSVRQVFDLMPKETADDWEVIATRLEKVPVALAGYRVTLAEGVRRRLTAARRQVEAGAAQARTWAGEGSPPFFATYIQEAPPGLDARLRAAADAATSAYAELAQFLTETYLPTAAEQDAVGPDRYHLAARRFLGADIDLVDTYAWGWDELARIEDEMFDVAEEIVGSRSIDDAVHLLETDAARAIDGVDAFRGWLQDLMDRTIGELNGVHFDIPEPVQRVEAMIAPAGTAAAMYYTGPSEDFRRPGRTWYPTLGKTRFPTWGEVSIAYHEGVPGHHLQIAQVRYLAERLSAVQRTSVVSGHAEGWALYAERLMDELGFFSNPDHRLGFLRAQAMRAVRVIVDIGMHLELEIPPASDFHPGERWNPVLGKEFVDQRSRFPEEFMASEIIRYLGMPAQAISYKVGERVWLDAREESRRRDGAAFDLKAFHAKALDMGPLGLDLLRDELAAG